MTTRFEVNPAVSNDALNPLFERAWPAHKATDFGAILKHALFYVCAFEGDRIVGFVKVVWDGGIHGDGNCLWNRDGSSKLSKLVWTVGHVAPRAPANGPSRLMARRTDAP
jgi:hypothetical protein